MGEINGLATAVSKCQETERVPRLESLLPAGPHCYHGRITKQGNAHARWLLVQAAQHLAQYRGPPGQTMRKIVKRKNRNVAVVACARKLAVLPWHVLTSGEPFRYAEIRTLQAKYSRLRVRATGHSAAEAESRKAHRAHRNTDAGRTFASPGACRKWPAQSCPAFQRREGHAGQQENGYVLPRVADTFAH